MSKITLAFVSFVAGISSAVLFFMLSGNQTSTLAQTRGVVIEGAEPTIPPLHANVFTGTHLGGVEQQLDGFECLNCEFSNVTLTYAGGAARIVNPKFSGTTRVIFKGAAANTLATVGFLQAMLQKQKPPMVNPNAPIIRTATATEPFVADLVTPYGQK